MTRPDMDRRQTIPAEQVRDAVRPPQTPAKPDTTRSSK